VGIEIKNRLKNENITLSLPSQRVDRFDENITNILGGMHQGSFTFAPEAGTQRMRYIINNGLTNEELLRGVKTAWEQGWETIKLYFMIGLPGETDADFWGITETVNWLQQECRVRGKKLLSLNLRISNFTPKPHTPFQWHSVYICQFKRKKNLLRQQFRRIRNVKVNFTDIRLSAMEDFIGRGDRSLGKVLRRAWELGATMDSWYDNNHVEQAFSAWGTVIAEAGLDWKYRQVRNGEFNLFSVGNGEQETENGEQDILSPITVRLSPLDITLPWDNIDTRFNKQWLYEDLKLALEAAIVPDCSFEGCSHCGVCGTDLSHNIVIKPPGIPKFAGDVIPNTTKVQPLRVQFGKHGDMALVSHLDLMRLFDRIIGRGGIPVAFTGGFHPHSRIALASALYLGSTSSGEIVDFELTQPMDLGSFPEQLISQLPSDILIYHVEEIDLKAPAANQAMQAAKYLRTVSKVGDMTTKKWQEWIEAIKITEELLVEHTTKSGKYQMINLRDRLFDLQLIEAHNSPTQSKAVLHYLGSCRHNAVILRPEQLLSILEKVAKAEFHLLHIHSNQLLLEI
jgi:radical SAM-linked protein